MTKTNEQHQFDLLYMPHNVFERNTYKYILTGVDVASRYKVTRALRTKKSSEVASVAILNIPRYFNVIMAVSLKVRWQSCLKNTMLIFEERQQKTAFVEAFNKELAKLLFEPVDAQELQDSEKVSTIRIKNLDKAV